MHSKTSFFAIRSTGHVESRPGETAMNRSNVLYLFIGALVVAVAVLSYQLYEAKKEPKGVQLNIGERGISIETK
jgi:RsiW-degrading membrane proteinase PrsW (M82 family)